jgi:hypothetical protein
MSFLRRLRSDRDLEIEALRHRVLTLQAALKQSREMAGQSTHFRRGITAGIAVLMLTLGLALGVYQEPLKQFASALAQVTGFASPAPSADDAYAAYQNRDYATALRLASQLAAEGDARAQFLLGLVYYSGRGVSRNHSEAAKWFRQAADQGEANAQFQLGVIFSQGDGVSQNFAEAAKWFRLAADQGDAQAQYNLGMLYAKGQAGEPDNVSAYMWFNLAAAHFPQSDVRHDTAVASRDLLAKQMTPDQIVAAQEQGREWKPK